MPTFAHPILLLLILSVPPLLWLWRRRGRTALLFSNVSLVASLPKGRSRRAFWGGLLLRGLGLSFLVVALAGPRWPDAGTRLPTEGIAIAMVVDVSASMNEPDFSWQHQLLTRLEGVKKVFRLFVTGGDGTGGAKLEPRPNDLVSLVVFATRPETACPLTLDHTALLKILDAEQPRRLATEATTNPGDALSWALIALNRAPTRRKVLMFLTDGESNVPPPALTPRQAAQLAGNLGIPIYAIGAGPELAKVPQDAKDAKNLGAARESLREIAHISGGRYFPAADGNALAEACSQIDELERTRITSFQYRRYHEGFAIFALLGLAAWLVVVGLECTRWRRVP